ncbi:MBL fold metallo-hydrolase [Chloroflexota bacterium]
MKIKYLGHACFVIISDAGIRIVTDPYEPSETLTYGEIRESADIVTVSHEHFDHNNASAVGGNPRVVRGAGTADIKGIAIKGIASYHDDAEGVKRGNNTIFRFEVDGMVVCHLGDLGHRLSAQQAAELGPVDVLLIPVGGFYTIDARVATEVCSQINARVIIPMHFKTEKGIPNITGIDDFLRGKSNVSRLGSSEVELGELPTATQIIVMESAL